MDDFIESSLWQLYRTRDATKIERLFHEIAEKCDEDVIQECIDKAWEE